LIHLRGFVRLLAELIFLLKTPRVVKL
jgi:hypothetical protein